MTSPKEKSLQTLINEADEWFSKFVRLSYADEFGMIVCSCGCGQRKRWAEMHASHYCGRGNYLTRFDFHNVVPATGPCNKYDQEHKRKIGLFIDRKFGEATTAELDWAAKVVQMKFTRPEIVEILDSYKLKFNELKKAKGL